VVRLQNTGQLNRALYRQDIQGLRAVAVLGVLLYHSGFYASSGFIGVDIFFVISGFVITSVLINHRIYESRFNFLHFYARRLLRLLPALGTVIFVTVLLSLFLLSPMGMQQNTAKTGVGGLLIVGNWVISKASLGYFDLPASTNPLLHIWSLSVEEQFYLFFPFVLFGLFYLQRKFKSFWIVTPSLLFISGASFWFFSYQEHKFDLGNFAWLLGFYSPVPRAWEFLIGSTIFLYGRKFQKRPPKKITIRFCDLVFLLLVGMMLMPEDTFKFPNVSIVFPLGCVSLLLFFGGPSLGSRNGLLEGRVLNYLGDRSYSIYLWHWPFTVFANYLFPNNPSVRICIITLSICISFLSFRFLETPIRTITVIGRKIIVRVLIVFFLLPILSSLSLGYISSEILFDKYESNIAGGRFEGDIGGTGFIDFSNQFPSSCGADSRHMSQEILKCDLDVLIVGDSHARHLVPGFVSEFPEIKFAAIDPLIVTSYGSKIGEALLSKLKENTDIKLVVFSSYWSQNGVPIHLPNLIKDIHNSGKSVLVLDGTPNFPFDAFTCKYGLSPFLHSGYCEMPSGNFNAERNIYLPRLRSSTSDFDDSILVNTSRIYCDTGTCSMIRNSKLHFMDMNHLNTIGSRETVLFIVKSNRIFCNLFRDNLDKAKC
jgi:peptidoglycan/LPS O-acetylase OafA/YrhL